MKQKQKASLKNWNIKKYVYSDSLEVKEYYVLEGLLISHPDLHFNDGHDHFVRTSVLIKIDFENKIAETLNTIYELL
ncbi:MAG: hypothetical protein JXM74_03910 [Fusobacteriaceae bacterium]|nr:hypothetical protein [Fusobacteriaceae bacterium]